MREPDPGEIDAAARGDRGAFERLVRRYQPEVWRLALHIVRDGRLAEDVAQEAFLRVYRFLPRFKGDSTFSTWLYSITRNCAIDVLKRSGRQAEIVDRLRNRPGPSAIDPGVRMDIKEAIWELTLELREPLVLIDMFEMTYGEVARILGVPVGTVKSRVFRARNRLIDALGSEPREVQGED